MELSNITLVGYSRNGKYLLLNGGEKDEWYTMKDNVKEHAKKLGKGAKVDIKYNQEEKERVIFYIGTAGSSTNSAKSESGKADISGKERQESIERQKIADCSANILAGMDNVTIENYKTILIDVFNTLEGLVMANKEEVDDGMELAD